MDQVPSWRLSAEKKTPKEFLHDRLVTLFSQKKDFEENRLCGISIFVDCNLKLRNPNHRFKYAMDINKKQNKILQKKQLRALKKLQKLNNI